MSNDTQGLLVGLPVSFDDRFLQDYAGQLISDPRIAVIELIANAYDAGATAVEIRWPTSKNEEFSVADNGTGMTRAELERRWTKLNYNRLQEQGELVQFPPSARKTRRVAFGRNGKGRLAAFCFADSYSISTWRDGRAAGALVELSQVDNVPFRFTILSEDEQPGHGTRIWANVERRLIAIDELVQIIGAKFLVDPTFRIRVNGQPVQLTDLKGLETTTLGVEPYGEITIYQIDAGDLGRAAGQVLGRITWRVNQRMVGEPSWDRLEEEGAYLDGRTEEAKRFSFIVAADVLKEDVKADWTDFHACPRVHAVKQAVHSHILRQLDRLLAGTRKDRKRAALAHSRALLQDLPIISQRVISHFVDEVQEKCPTLHPRDLSRTVEVLAKLEQTRSGYDLLRQLSACSLDDLDTWNRLMQRWTATKAEIVLNELQLRLTLIERMQRLVEDPKADELHDLQPLFERGLWIFGPEYEAVDFRANRSLKEVIERLLGGTNEPMPRDRPDVVALPDRSIGVYGADAYDDEGQISGLRKVLIVELKRGGFRLTQGEVDQARDYAKHLRKGGRVQPDTEIVGYVLGAILEDGLEWAGTGNRIAIYPMTFQTVLQRAHARTFHLQRRIEESQPSPPADAEMQEVLVQKQQADFLDDLKSA